MSSTKLRRRFIGTMAFIMVAAVVALAPVSAAKGGPEPSPFAGTYEWTGDGLWAVTISDNGHITGSLVSSFDYTKGSVSGRVEADGSYTFTMSVTAPVWDDPDRGHRGGNRQWNTNRTTFSGILAPDANGNLVGTPDAGGSFTWLRQ
jgi:hypothetical protein